MEYAKRKSLVKIKDEVQYFQHQADGIRWMIGRDSFLLADEMGLGKSLQALTVAAVDFEPRPGWDPARRIIIVAPVTLKWNWEEEVKKFTNFSCMVLDGTPKKREQQLDEFEKSDCEILIVNYEQVRGHLARLNKLWFDIAIFDEAHYIKGHKSQRTKACHALSAPRSFVLTGSPMLNQVDELWSILHRIDPDRWPSYWSFVNRYAVYGGYQQKQITGVKHKEELNSLLSDPGSGIMIRRLKKDWLDLPDKQYIPVVVDLLPAQEKYYKQAVEEMKIEALEEGKEDYEIENPLVRFGKLKGICGTTAFLGDEYGDHSHKLDRAVEMLQEKYDNGEKVVVFTQFREVQKRFVERCQKIGIECYQLHGDVKKESRPLIKDAWGADPKPKPLVVMLQVGREGLNLTAARTAFFLDKLFVPKLNEQAEDRIHRIGSSTDATQPVQIYQFICKGTIEDRVEQILGTKRKTFNSLIEESAFNKALYDQLKKEL